MCHDDDSRPPAPPEIGGVATHHPLILTAADGNRFSAYLAEPASPNGRSVVILPDVRGLHPYYPALAERFAEAGFHTIAIDYFGRTAGPGERGDGFEFRPHVDQVDPANVVVDVAAAIDGLREHNPGGPVYSVGFCFGGAQSWRLSASDLDIAGTIGFYGKPERVEDVFDRLTKPMLLLVAGADRATPLAEFEKFAERLDARGTPYEMHVYEGAPHSFFDRSHAEWADACADAWRRILAFTS